VTNSPTGNYTITNSLGTLIATNYTVDLVNGSLSVTGAVLTATANNATRAYGTTNPVFTVSYSGYVNGETNTVLSGAPLLSTSAITNSPVGSYVITNSLGTLVATNYTVSLVNGSLTVTGAVLTITADSGLTANNKVYDGTTVATISSNNVVLTGTLPGDVVSLSTNGYTATFASAGVANGINVTVNGLMLIGANATNYTLVQPVQLTADITPKALTVVSAPSPTITSIRLTNNVATITWGSASGGIYRVQSKDSLNGPTWNNLSPDVTGTGLSVVQTNNVSGVPQRFYRIMVLNPGLTANNKVYDGTTTATINSNNVTLVGVVAGDVVGVSTNGYTASFASPDVGTGIPVTVSGLTLTGVSATNYSLTQPTGLTANITVIGVTINSGIKADNKVYDGTMTATISSNNVILNGVLAGDAANVRLLTNNYTASFASPGVGAGIGVAVSGLVLTGAGATNYTLTQPTGLTANITPATLGVSAVNKSRTYGLPNLLSVNYSGFVSGDGTNVLSGAPSLSTSATTNSPPGPYPITVGSGTLSAANYTFVFTNGTLTVVGLPQLSTVALKGNQLLFSLPTVNGQTYQVQYNDNLTTATWTNLNNSFVGTGNLTIITNGLGVSPHRFFRLKISP
jgi:hypothetical protein